MEVLAKLDQDLKAAMLAGDKFKVSVLKSLKSACQYAKVAPGNDGADLTDEAVLVVFAKEAKKRQESADLYAKAGAAERSKTELKEKVIIDEYLPAQMSDDELNAVIDEVVAGMGSITPQDMGRVIGAVKQKTGGLADGSRIAQAVKGKLG